MEILLYKNTHTATPVCLSTFLELFLLPFGKTKLLSTLIHSSIVRSELSSPLHSSTRNQAVLSPPTSLAVWDQNHISPSLSVLQCTFSPCDFWLDFSRSILFSFPYLKNCSCIVEGDTFFALFVLTSRANCDQLIPFPFSAMKPFHWEVSFIAQSQQRKKSPHKKTVYQSRQSRRVLLCQATSVWVLPRESQTSRIIPTTTPPLQLAVKSRRKEDLLLLYCYYIFIYYIHRHFHTLSHTTHKQKTHNSMI